LIVTFVAGHAYPTLQWVPPSRKRHDFFAPSSRNKRPPLGFRRLLKNQLVSVISTVPQPGGLLRITLFLSSVVPAEYVS
jgi:hypothetical protein